MLEVDGTFLLYASLVIFFAIIAAGKSRES